MPHIHLRTLLAAICFGLVVSAANARTTGGSDADGDGVVDSLDNCVQAPNPLQRDTDSDGIGNVCDADIGAPNDCVVNVVDLGVLRSSFFGQPGDANWNPDADFNGDDIVNVVDLGVLRGAFFAAPGPSGIPNACNDTTPGACPRTLPAVASGTCDVTTGPGSATLIQGDVFLATGLLTNAEVLVDDGDIVCTGCDCSNEAQFATATKLVCTDAVISPGLINGRVSASFSHNPPFNNPDRYQQRHDWRLGRRGNTQLSSPFGGGSDQVKWEELRSVMAGVTSTVASGNADGMIRNLDRNDEFASRETTDVDTFPLGDSNGTQLASGCAYPNVENQTPSNSAVWRVAEGIDAEARNEFLCLSGIGTDSTDVLEAPVAIDSGAGLTFDDIVSTVTRGTRLVWTPRSDTSLYGNTAMVPVFKAAGAKIGLGTVWSASGSANIARELACAAQWSDRWGGVFSDEELVSLATKNVAQLAGFGDVIGEIAAGRAADLTIWNTGSHDGLQAIINAQNEDVALVMRDGVPLYGDDNLVQALVPADNCEQVDVCGESKRLCAEREFGETLTQIVDDAPGGAYGLFACGAWPDEPTCLPSRVAPDAYMGTAIPGDADGDGVDDATDNCVGVFNPPTPLDPGVQADSDGDGLGDLCDLPDAVAPVGGFDPPPPQLITIYEAKTDTDLLNQIVTLNDMIVTAVSGDGFWCQLATDSADFAGAGNSGIYSFVGETPGVAVGDRITIERARLIDFFSQRQLSDPAIRVEQTGLIVQPTLLDSVALQDLIAAQAASPFEGVLVTVQDVAVTDPMPAGGPGDSGENEFEVASGLRVDDLIFLIDPQPGAGEIFSSIAGPVAFRNNLLKLLPRGPSDVIR